MSDAGKGLGRADLGWRRFFTLAPALVLLPWTAQALASVRFELVTGVVGSDVLLARLTLRGTGPAGTQLTGAVTPGDLNEGFPLVGSGFDAFTFAATLLAAVPEPGSALLVAAGLLILCAGGLRA